MLTYDELLKRLKGEAEEEFARFQRKLIDTKAEILGVRTPTLRKIAKQLYKDSDSVLTFPDEYYEVTFLKLCLVSQLPYEKFLQTLDISLSWLDNWATCDTFKPVCIKRNLDEFLPVLLSKMQTGKEFYQRFVLVMLLTYYTDPKYLEVCKTVLKQADLTKYYVHMGTAWLTAELLIKNYDGGLEIIKENLLPAKTHNKAIQKAKESFRITAERKEYLNILKREKD